MNELIRLISEDIIYSKQLPYCNNGLCDTYYFHGISAGLIDKYPGIVPLVDYVSDWEKQFKNDKDKPAWLYNEDESKTSWNESRYNLVLLLFLNNGGEL